MEILGNYLINLIMMLIRFKIFIQKENKKKFPYLSGTKICNYWLYVIGNIQIESIKTWNV